MSAVGLLFIASVSFCLSYLAVLATRWTGSLRNDMRAVQAMHLHVTSRFGGIAIFLSFGVFIFLFAGTSQDLVVRNLACALPILFVGLAEDAGWHVAPRWRLLAAAMSSLLIIQVTGFTIERFGVPMLDLVVTVPVLSVALTVLVVSGVTHAFNLVDGMHGLCGFTSLIIAVALVLIEKQGARAGFGLALIPLVAGLIGFLLLNFPRGILFLGDAGATGMGFILAASGVEMMSLLPNLSPWSLVLVFFWPIADMLLTIGRRMGRRRPAMRPDRMHFHHVVMRAFEILVLRKKNRAVSNPAATLILLPLIATPSALGVVLWNHNLLAFEASLFFGLVFVGTYRAVVGLAKRHGNVGLLGRRAGPVLARGPYNEI